MKIHITGVAGAVGSALAKILTEKGYDVQGNDVARIEEAWRLRGVELKYIWRATEDLSAEDLSGVDLIIDAGLAVPDRPLGTASPMHAMMGNLIPPLRLLELARRLDRRPMLIYLSSFNSLYGWGDRKYFEGLPPNPSTVYGWTKAAAELLYMTYKRSFGVSVVITRVGSAYGPGGRADELPHKLILYGLMDKTFRLRSPRAVRAWTYIEDVLNFYATLVDFIDGGNRCEVAGNVFHVAGAKDRKTVTNMELAETVARIVPLRYAFSEDEYEPGEGNKANPLKFEYSIELAEKMFRWRPEHTLEEGLRKTADWFKEHLHLYT
jgi:nucleoside-diphosphate-sugar epimerase